MTGQLVKNCMVVKYFLDKMCFSKVDGTNMLTLKRHRKIAADFTLFFYFYLSKEIGMMFHVNPLLSRGFT